VPNRDLYLRLLEECRQKGATLVVVTKNRTEKEVMNLYQMGQRIFAENRPHELIIKASLLPTDIEWHLIGHLQTNKVKAVIPYVSMIQSVDSWKLWTKIQQEAIETQKKIKCLLQIKIGTEDTKHGWLMTDLIEVLQKEPWQNQSNIELHGVMGITSLTNHKEQVKREMNDLIKDFEYLKKNYFQAAPHFHSISMGMSGDYAIALEEGSNMIRVGSLLFD